MIASWSKALSNGVISFLWGDDLLIWAGKKYKKFNFTLRLYYVRSNFIPYALTLLVHNSCPQCGIGTRELHEIWQAAKVASLCLLIHPDKPGVIKIGLAYSNQEENAWGDWVVHRFRFVEEPALAETIIWELLGHPLPHDREPIQIDLIIAEQAFRDLLHQMYSEIALEAKVSSFLQDLKQDS